MNAGGLTQAQIGQYKKDGYLVVNDLLTASEVETFLAEEAKEKPQAWKELALRRYTVDPQWQFLAKHPKISGMVSQLMQGSPRIVQTMYMNKRPEGGTGVALHQDTHYIRNEPNTLMACWLALSDTDKDNGGLCVVPGSHTRPLYQTAAPKDDSEHAKWEKVYQMRGPDGQEWDLPMTSHEILGLDPSEIVYLSVPKGSGVFFTSMTIHGSFANRSGTRPRLAFATHYVKEGTWVYRTDIQETVPVFAGS
ncbi:MAG: phytanoyl-CoA dioxygenase family protein [Candidatus Latescibacterota bacterium]